MSGGAPTVERPRWADVLSWGRSQLWWQSLCALFLVAYCLSLVFVERPASGYLSLWDGWVGNIAPTLPLVPVLLRVWRTTVMRPAWIAIAAGIALNSTANLVYLFHDQNQEPVPYPALSDVPYLLSYVAFAIGIVMMTQSAFGRRYVSIRLDGLIAGLAIGSLAVVLWFGSFLTITGSPLEVAVGMAYPLFDVVLLVLMVAGLAPQRYRPSWPLGLLMAGMSWFVVGDFLYYKQNVASTYVGGTLLDGTWPLGIFLIGLAAWPRAERRSRRGEASGAPVGIALVPIAAGCLAIAVLAVSVFRGTVALASAMALGALVGVIIRMGLTLREVRAATSGSFRDARTDALTGLPNRRAFLESTELASGSDERGRHRGVLLADLDRFKDVNDSLGHGAGDELLGVVAQRLEHLVGDRGVLARIGGDEFAVSCLIGSRNELVALAHELAATLTDPVVLDHVTVRVGASIGVAFAPDDGSSLAELLHSADVAMYAAKQSQSAVCSYHPDLELNGRDRLTMIQELRTAIDDHALVLHYQPTLDMRTATVCGVEALVRWPHPTRGLLPPDSFIPLAEQLGLIPGLTRVVLALAIAEAGYLDRAGHRLQMSVNISRYDLVDENLPTYIDELLATHCVRHERLTLEVTESCLSEHPDQVARAIHGLRKRGIRISIDDFGVGYSSISQLLELPIDELKIDRSFIAALGHNVRSGAVIRSTIELGRALDLTVVAEGLESLDTLTSLRGLGTDIAQGYHIARPLTADQLDAYLAEPRPHGLLPESESAPSVILETVDVTAP
jgi:diguanylate cyclase (GGDEF)-like protein